MDIRILMNVMKKSLVLMIVAFVGTASTNEIPQNPDGNKPPVERRVRFNFQQEKGIPLHIQLASKKPRVKSIPEEGKK
jgi:hypothetical protein